MKKMKAFPNRPFPNRRVTAFAVALCVTLVAACLPARTAYAGTLDGSAQAQAPAQTGLLPAASRGVANKVLVREGVSLYSKTVRGYDVTGDGRADTVRFQTVEIGPYSSDLVRALRIYVNGRLCKTMRTDYGFYRNWITIKYLRLGNGKPFLFVKCCLEGSGAHEVLQYSGGRLRTMVSQKWLPTGYGNHQQISDVTAKGSSLRVTFSYMTYAASALEMTYTFKPRGSALKPTSSTTTGISYPDENFGYGGTTKWGKPWDKASWTFKAYASTALKKAKFTVRRGQRFKFTAACVKNKKLYLKVSTAGGKTGWIQAPRTVYQKYGWKTLTGTMMAG